MDPRPLETCFPAPQREQVTQRASQSLGGGGPSRVAARVCFPSARSFWAAPISVDNNLLAALMSVVIFPAQLFACPASLSLNAFASLGKF